MRFISDMSDYAKKNALAFGSFPPPLFAQLLGDNLMEAEDLEVLYRLLRYYYPTFRNDSVIRDLKKRHQELLQRKLERLEISSTAATVLNGTIFTQ